MKYRPHRGGLGEAMKECVELGESLSELRDYIGKDDKYLKNDTIKVRLYSDTPDTRIGWDRTYIVTADYIDGVHAAVGFTDKMPI